LKPSLKERSKQGALAYWDMVNEAIFDHRSAVHHRVIRMQHDRCG
jgi:hypothetical protein